MTGKLLLLISLFSIGSTANSPHKSSIKMYPVLENYINTRVLPESCKLSPERIEKLDVLISYINEKVKNNEAVQLNFICTHNSRRSHLSQTWAQIAAAYHNVPSVSCYSGGTEATAFNPRAVAALQRAGIKIVSNDEGSNPVYQLTFAEKAAPMQMFSKTYNHAANPTGNFAAIMTCNDADKNCPFIPGAKRISLPYRDPKEADNTPEEAGRYDERCLQIAAEMFYIFAKVK